MFPKPKKEKKVRKPMKRLTGLKQKKGYVIKGKLKAVKLSPIRKTVKIKRITITKAKKRANTAFSIYIRTRDMLRGQAHDGLSGMLQCVTCPKWYPAFGVGCAQCGHFLPGRHPAVLYDERNAAGQCYNCNVNLKGNWVKYYAYMLKTYGQEVIDELIELDKQIGHYKVEDYLEKEKEYKRRLGELETK